MDSPQAPDTPQGSGDAWLAALRSSAATEEFPKSRPAGTASKAAEAASSRLAGSRPIAFVAAAVVAVLGGLLWAGVVIETRYDIGILAWLVGVAAGRTLALVANGRVGTVDRVVAGLLAAGGIIVGKYVIFVHDVKVSLGRIVVGAGDRVGYLAAAQRACSCTTSARSCARSTSSGWGSRFSLPLVPRAAQIPARAKPLKNGRCRGR